MDEVLKRLSVLETAVTDIRLQVVAIATLLPSLATKAELGSWKAELKEDIHSVRTEVSATTAVLPHLATKAEIQSMEASIIRWIIGTTIATAALAFAIAKFAS